MRNQRLRVAQLGYGSWGPNVLRNLLSTAGAEVVAVADPDRERLAELARRGYGMALTVRPDEVFARRDVDAVLIVTPARGHAALVCQALEAGKHVFVEKPLALSSAEARRVVDLAERRRLTLMVGHTFLYATPVQMLKDYVDSGELGALHYLHSQRLNCGRVRDDVNVLWSVGPHDVSIFLHLLGATPVEVSARGISCLRPHIEDAVFLTMLFPGGVTAQAHLSWIDPLKVRRVTLVGERKAAVYDDTDPASPIVLYDRGVERTAARRGGGPASYPEPLGVECEHFVDCVVRGVRPLSDGEQGLEVVRVLEAADRSMAEHGRPVRLDSGRG